MGLFATDAVDALYEFDPQTTITDAQPNVIYLRRELTYGARQDVDNSIIDRAHRDKRGMPELRLERRAYAKLQAFIVRWEGPDLDGQPINEQTFRKFNWSDPFFQRVLTAIDERYGEEKEADAAGDGESPNDAPVVSGVSGGSTSSVATRHLSLSANGMGTSYS
ncbi:MAG TPA: hypothetical protein VFT66_15630 [Roseiflexaceae bacterium]|nr:hypothetical protein [Roseiflexaceae bacterium]